MCCQSEAAGGCSFEERALLIRGPLTANDAEKMNFQRLKSSGYAKLGGILAGRSPIPIVKWTGRSVNIATTISVALDFNMIAGDIIITGVALPSNRIIPFVESTVIRRNQ